MNALSDAQRRRVLCHLIATGLVGSRLAASGRTWGQSSGRVVKLIVPTSPSSSADIAGGMVCERVQRVFGLPVIVHSDAGADARVTALAVAAAEPNGETIGVLGNAYPLFPVEYPHQKFDPLQNVVSVVLVAGKSPYTKLDDLVGRPCAEPGRLAYGTGSKGCSTHHAAERLKLAAGLDLIHVPYKASPEIVQARIGGQIDFGVGPVPVAEPSLQSGHIRALAVARPSARRFCLKRQPQARPVSLALPMTPDS